MHLFKALKFKQKIKKKIAPREDRTLDLQITLSLVYSDYETDALPTALLRLYDIKTVYPNK